MNLKFKTILVAAAAAVTVSVATLVPQSAEAQSTTFIADDLVQSNMFLVPGPNLTTFTNNSVTYPQSGGYASTIDLAPAYTQSPFETFTLISSQNTGTNGGGTATFQTGTNWVAIQYGLYMDDASRAYPPITTIPGTTNALPLLYAPVTGYGGIQASNYWQSVTNNGTATYKLVTANYYTSSFTNAAVNFYGAKWYRIIGINYVTTNTLSTISNSVVINRLRGGHWVSGLVGH